MLTRIYIHNFRSFVNFELRPGRIGLLVGSNGAGKSSIFRVLAAISGLVRGLWETSEAFPAETLTLFGDGTQQRFELDLEGPHGPVRYTLVLDHDREEETCKITHEEVSAGGERLYWYADGKANFVGVAAADINSFPFTANRSFLATMEQPKQTVPAMAWFLAFVSTIWILKLNPQTATEAAKKDQPGLNADGSNFPAWCRHLVLERRERMEAGEAALREILPGFRSLSLVAAGRARVLVVRFASPGQRSYDVDFDKLSDGQRALIILYISLYAIRDSMGLLCFDEPDNFVAIREIQPFLVELVRQCDDAAQQVLLISHSAEVIDFFGVAATLPLERPDGAVTRVGELRTDTGLKLSELLARGWHGAR